MTFRNTVDRAQVGVHTVTIARDSDTGEYRCRIVCSGVPRPAADYFTDCPDDARRTAWAPMARACQHRAHDSLGRQALNGALVAPFALVHLLPSHTVV
jgi:hypothetical protein